MVKATPLKSPALPRLLQIADVPEVMRILAQVYFEDYPYPVGGSWTSRDVERELEAGTGFGIFTENYKLLAFILFRKSGDAFDITMLATDRECRRRGYMETLLKHLKSMRGSAKEIWLEVHEKNIAARNFYEKQGFTLKGRRPGYYRDGCSAILYTLI